MTMDQAIEAGMLAQALRAMPDLIEAAEGEASGPLTKGHITRWKSLALEVWGNDMDGDSGERVGEEINLPPAFLARTILPMVKDYIAAHLVALGVTLDEKGAGPKASP